MNYIARSLCTAEPAWRRRRQRYLDGRAFESSVYTERVTNKRTATMLLAGVAALLLGSLAQKYARKVGQGSAGHQG
ncbi:MAG: hypothetical protein JWQ24_5515 [Tardiphaga sp.]|jgi:hypothetical protein|nr:hypothetical protein [Tardiphaga sp.]